MMRLIYILLLVGVAFLCHGQDAKTSDTLTNRTVIQLYKAGFGKEVVKKKIETSQTNFNLSVDSIIALKKAGLPEEVISAMLSVNQTSTSSINQASSATKYGMLLQGLYYYDSASVKFIELNPSIVTKQKSGGIGEALARSVSALFNEKSRIALSGAKANVSIARNHQAFIFVFDTANRGLSSGSVWTNVQSPNEFILVKLKVVKETRELVVGKGNSINYESGIDDAARVPFVSKQTNRGVFEVSFAKALEPGEYCFMFASSSMYEGSSHKVYDFGVSATK